MRPSLLTACVLLAACIFAGCGSRDDSSQAQSKHFSNPADAAAYIQSNPNYTPEQKAKYLEQAKALARSHAMTQQGGPAQTGAK